MEDGTFPLTKFIAIDFETANADLASVCQVGIALFENGKFVESWGTLINPADYFDEMNISVHGIDEHMVRDAPAFHNVYETLSQKLGGNVAVCHTHFDRAVMSQVLHKHSLPNIDCHWLDSSMVVRRTWEKWAKRGYGLPNVCRELGIEYKAHDAVEDARAAGEVLIRAMADTGSTVADVLTRVKRPIDPRYPERISLQGNLEGALVGEELVFTGMLGMPRREAALMAARVGCNVSDSVKKTTTLLVVGDQDILKLAGHEKSTKHRKAEMLISKGHPIRILRETDFIRLVEISQ